MAMSKVINGRDDRMDRLDRELGRHLAEEDYEAAITVDADGIAWLLLGNLQRMR